jgi:hypothetical protein
MEVQLVTSTRQQDKRPPAGGHESDSRPHMADEENPDPPSYSPKKLFEYAKSTAGNDDFYSLTFGVLHRLNIIHLHNKLALIKYNLYEKESALEDDLVILKDTLSDYGIANSVLLEYTNT